MKLESEIGFASRGDQKEWVRWGLIHGLCAKITVLAEEGIQEVRSRSPKDSLAQAKNMALIRFFKQWPEMEMRYHFCRGDVETDPQLAAFVEEHPFFLDRDERGVPVFLA